LPQIATQQQGVDFTAISGCEIGLGVNGQVVAGAGFVQTAQQFERVTTVEIGLRVAGSQSDGGVVTADCRVGSVEFLQGGAQVAVGSGIVRFEIDGFLIVPQRIGGLPQRGERIGPVVKGFGVIGLQADSVVVKSRRPPASGPGPSEHWRYCYGPPRAPD
jgi:hypothetical protein